MALNKTLLKGKIIPLDIRNINGQYKESDVRGISTQKEFIETKADLTGVNLNSYKIVPPKCFAYVPDTSRRGDKMALAYNDTNQAYLISSIYTVFQVNENSGLDADYLGIFFNRESFDRYARFHSWGTAREVFDWAELEQTAIALPDIDTQRKYVAIYKAMQKNQHNYERGLEDFKLVIDSTLDNFKNKYSSKPVSDILEEVNVRNTDNKHSTAMGINLNKQFMPSKSTSANLSNYKIVNTGEFACNFMHVGRDEALPISMLSSPESVIVSPAYATMKVKPDSNILSQYIMMWFSRSETDRYAGFLCDGSVRGNLDLSSFMNIKIPIPPINEQQSLVELYNVYLKRLELNERLKSNLKSLCPILIRGAITEAEAKA